MKVFVYGTLRQGQGNHGLLEGATRVGELGMIRGLLYVSPYGLPAVIPGQGQVIGECYELKDPEQLAILDNLEGYKEGRYDNFYERRECEVALDGSSTKAFAYFFPEAKEQESREDWSLVVNGDYVDFRKGGF